MLQQSLKEQLLNQRAVVIWLTGLSGSGKSTLALQLQKELFNRGYLSQVMDGDLIRSGLNKDLGFSLPDRLENIRRIAETTKLFLNCGIICINSFITPTRKIRMSIQDLIGKENMIEIYLSASLEFCEKRDIKGLYKKTRNGEIKNFTGITSPFEAPEDPDIEVDSEILSVEESVAKCLPIILERIQYKVGP
ncbi:MAG: adenylyl-sulfate kinase [Prolixibacteraceae bacterium]